MDLSTPTLAASARSWFGRVSRATLRRTEPEGVRFMLGLKKAHSARVARLARWLARRMDWPAPEQDLAATLGWLHDIGRFPQLVRAGHLHDNRALDHGALGARMLSDWPRYHDLSPADRSTLRLGIRHHNALTVPAGLPGRADRHLRLVRDADKLDILTTLLTFLQQGEVRRLAPVFPHIDFDGPLNPAVIACLRRGRACSYQSVRSLNDMLAVQLQWLRELEYPAAARWAQRQKLLERLAASLPDAEPLPDAVRAVRRQLTQHTQTPPARRPRARASGQALLEYVVVAGILLALVTMLALFLYTFKEYSGRILELIGAEYP